jgi:hypothetical protein
MGTRSETSFYDNEGREICRFYRQMDGYPSGHGVDLATACDRIIVNGYTLDMTVKTHANGMGCLAAQVIAALKADQGLGGIYMYPTNVPYGDWSEFTYHVTPEDDHVRIQCKDSDGKEVFNLQPDDVERWVTEKELA